MSLPQLAIEPIDTLLKVLLMLFLLVMSAQGHSTGAPESACDSMTPGHPGRSEPLPGPYSLTLSKTSYIPFEVVNVTINAPEDSPFLGFMLQARDVSTNALYGNFLPAPETKIICNQVLTHVSNGPKKSRTFTWRAPFTGTAKVVFRATVVKEYFTYYVDFRSSLLNPRKDSETTTSDTATTSSTTTTTTTTPSTTSKVTMTTTGSTKSTVTKAKTTTYLSTYVLSTVPETPTTSTLASSSSSSLSFAPTNQTFATFRSVSTTPSTITEGTKTLKQSTLLTTRIATSVSSRIFTTSLSSSPQTDVSSTSQSPTSISLSSMKITNIPPSLSHSSTSPSSTGTPTSPSSSKDDSPVTRVSPTSLEPTSFNPTVRVDTSSPSSIIKTIHEIGKTQVPAGSNSLQVPEGADDEDDDDDKNLTLYLSLGLVSGWACVIVLGYFIRHARKVYRDKTPPVVAIS